MPYIAFIAGIIAGAMQLGYASKRFPTFSDLSFTSPAVYLIIGSFLVWLISAGITLRRFGVNRAWWVLSAPLALYLPSKFLLLLFGCSFISTCDL